jgi:hypothetical protein
MYAEQCIDALDRAGLTVVLVDHGSTWPPAKKFAHFIRTTGSRVHFRENAHPRSLWDWDEFPHIVGAETPYVVTDCDVVPDVNCPEDWPEVLEKNLQTHPDLVKVGLGLRVDNLPDRYEHAARVVDWEARYWENYMGYGAHGAPLYSASVDTTLAMYRPLREIPEFQLGPAARTGWPYVAKHLPWYEDSKNLSAELVYYREHAMRGASHWNDPDDFEGNR